MKYDLRIDGYFWREIEGRNIEDALNSAGLNVCACYMHRTGGYLYYDAADLYGMAKSQLFPDELNTYILNNYEDVIFNPTFGESD